MKTATFTTIDDSGIESSIDIDNTSNFKDFNIKFGPYKLSVQIDETTNTLAIGDCLLYGVGLEMFKQFISQLDKPKQP
jgi:hypothetical protein